MVRATNVRKDEATAGWDATMKEPATKRDAARVKLAEVHDSSAESWKDLRKEAQLAWDKLNKDLPDAPRRF